MHPVKPQTWAYSVRILKQLSNTALWDTRSTRLGFIDCWQNAANNKQTRVNS